MNHVNMIDHQTVHLRQNIPIELEKCLISVLLKVFNNITFQVHKIFTFDFFNEKSHFNCMRNEGKVQNSKDCPFHLITGAKLHFS